MASRKAAPTLSSGTNLNSLARYRAIAMLWQSGLPSMYKTGKRPKGKSTHRKIEMIEVQRHLTTDALPWFQRSAKKLKKFCSFLEGILF